jgi:hypothetical protein
VAAPRRTCARIARRERRAYREYLSVEPRREEGCIVRRVQAHFYHGLSRHAGVGESIRLRDNPLQGVEKRSAERGLSA